MIAAPPATRSLARRWKVALIAAIATPLLAVAFFAAFSSRMIRHRHASTGEKPQPSALPDSTVLGPTNAAPPPPATGPELATARPTHEATAPKSPGPPGSSSSAAPLPSPAAQACTACIAAANAGNVGEIALSLALCDDPVRRAECITASRKHARAEASSLPSLLPPRTLPAGSN
jgi:hypothetical protein